MTQLPNPFLNSSVISPRTEGSAAASKPTPVADAAAAPVSVSPGDLRDLCPSGEIDPSVMLDWAPGENLLSMTMEVLSEAPAEPQTVTVAASPAGATDQIHEIFFYARRLLKDDRRFVLDESRFLADIDETPLFLREDGYLQRREA